MVTTNLAQAFDEKSAQRPLLEPAAYVALLEKLLSHGGGYGKTAPVAAYLLRSLKLVRRTESHPEGVEQEIEFKPLYLVMDPKKIPNEFGRAAMFEQIAIQYARSIIGEADINSPDYKGPEIWTAKQSSFEFDYTRREGKNEQGRDSNMYDPNPDAYRLCLTLDRKTVIPTSWGDPWTVEPGGTIAVRERDVEALATALMMVRKGKASIEEALYVGGTDNKKSRFDVYGMEPGFLSDNYNPVALKQQTKRACRKFMPANPGSPTTSSPRA